MVGIANLGLSGILGGELKIYLYKRSQLIELGLAPNAWRHAPPLYGTLRNYHVNMDYVSSARYLHLINVVIR